VKDKNPIGYMIRDEVEGRPRIECPACFESDFENVRFQGDARVPETSFKRCNCCEHEWDHQ